MDVREKMLYDAMLEELGSMGNIKVTYSANFFGRCALFRFVGPWTTWSIGSLGTSASGGRTQKQG